MERETLPASKSTDLSATDHALTPEALFNLIQLRVPDGVVTVKGTVERLSVYPEYVYGTLRGQEAAIRFRCLATNAPEREHEHIVLRGTLSIKESNWHDGLDVTLDGDPVGTWTPKAAPTAVPLRTLRSNGKQSLGRFLREHGAQSLLVIATDTGYSDLQTAAKQRGADVGNWRRVRSRFDHKDTLLRDFLAACDNPDTKGVAFVRGGGPAKGLRLWDDGALIGELLKANKPFYTAIGHADDWLLVDQYSDESFATPTALGESLGRTLEEIQAEQKLKRSLIDARRGQEQLEEKLALLQASHRVWRRRFVFATVALVGLIVVGSWWLLNVANTNSVQTDTGGKKVLRNKAR